MWRDFSVIPQHLLYISINIPASSISWLKCLISSLNYEFLKGKDHAWVIFISLVPRVGPRTGEMLSKCLENEWKDLPRGCTGCWSWKGFLGSATLTSLFYWGREGTCLKETRFAGGRARHLSFSPVLIPLLCIVGKNQRTAWGRPTPSTSGSAARWTDSEVEQQMELSFEPRQQTTRLLQGGRMSALERLFASGRDWGNLRTHLRVAG